MRAVLNQDWGFCTGTQAAEVVRWLHAQGVRSYGSRLAFENQAGAGVQSPVHRPAPDAPDFLTFEAARQGNLDLLQVLVEECGAHWAESACVGAAENGSMEVLRWAISKHWSCAIDTWCAAVRRGGKHNDYRPLALLHRAQRPWSETVWAAAAPYPDVQAWLKERSCPGSGPAPAAGAGAAAV
jgi:hypothetical protein